MNSDRSVPAFAGILIILTAILGIGINPYWFFGAVFAGLTMLQAAFTRFSPLPIVLRKRDARQGSVIKQS